MSQCGGKAVRFDRGFHATSSTGRTLVEEVAPQKELLCMVSRHKTTGNFLAIATLGASPVRVNLEVSGNGFILLSNCNRTV
ncbi:MAG: hypothetical protein V7K40_04480 [Nostoc sp.]|uniref:hypothetical protein n=1 Tax=Nostoc sp. TaxID=1180 RepID=UPI002FF729D6